MLLGKRPRPPIKRTTSMTEITVDPTFSEPSDHQNPIKDHAVAAGPDMNLVPNGGYDQRLLSPRSTQRRNSGDHFTDTSHFLHTCGLCKRRLPPGRDIYMYRGDTAFCSLECREQQMKQDERKEKLCTVASKKEGGRHGSPSTASTKAASSKSGTVAAA